MAITATLSGERDLSVAMGARGGITAAMGLAGGSGGTAVILTSVTILASAWEGTESPYSQVVDVPGVTVNSKVDLQPSVEQLAMFHEKDLAFVTENEDGVITVFAIGDKPRNDYTIQATVMEVRA